MENLNVGIETRLVKADTSLRRQKSSKNSSPQFDLPIIIKYSSLVEDLHKSRKKLDGYKESIRDSESTKARAEVELSMADKLVKKLALMIDKLSRGTKLLKRDMEVLKIDTKVEENGNYVEVMRDLEAAKEELSRLKLEVDSVLRERIAAEKEAEELRVKRERNLRLLESLEKEIEVGNEEHFLAELGKMEALTEYKEIERQRERKAKDVLDLLLERNKSIKEILGEVKRSKKIEKKLLETSSDVDMLETELKLVKKMEKRVQRKDSRSNRSSFERANKYSVSVLKEVTEETEVKKEELASVNEELFRIMMVMNSLRNEVIQAKEETARIEQIFLREDDVKIEKLNSKMIMAKSKMEVALSTKERVHSLADNLVGSLEKLKKKKESARKEESLLKEEKMVTKAETQRTKLETEETERELISELDELEKAKQAEALVLEKLESLIEDTMKKREMESEHCSTITISRFEYEYMSRHACEAEETAEKKVAAAEAWVEAIKASTKAVLMKTETLMIESGMTQMEEEKEAFRTERSLSTKRLAEGEIEKMMKQKPETESYHSSPKPVGKSVPVQRGKPRRYSSTGTPTYFVIKKKKKKKVPTLVKFFGRRK